MNYAFHKDEAEIATRILLAAMQNEKFSCTAENVANFYKTIHKQIVTSSYEVEVDKHEMDLNAKILQQ